MLFAAVAAIALGLLGAAGVAKTVDPDPTGGALRAARLSSSPWMVRLLGGVEIAAAVLGLAFGGLWVMTAAVLYLGFVVFTTLAVRNVVPVQSCGCFGREDTPPSWLHVVFNLVALAGLIVVAITSGSPVPWDAPVIQIMVYVGFAALGTFLSYLLLTRLPQTLALSPAR